MVSTRMFIAYIEKSKRNFKNKKEVLCVYSLKITLKSIFKLELLLKHCAL